MKARKVVVTIEVVTDMGIAGLKQKELWKLQTLGVFDVQQVQVNVVQDKKKKKK